MRPYKFQFDDKDHGFWIDLDSVQMIYEPVIVNDLPKREFPFMATFVFGIVLAFQDKPRAIEWHGGAESHPHLINEHRKLMEAWKRGT